MANQFQANTFIPGMENDPDGAGGLYSRGGSSQGDSDFNETRIPSHQSLRQPDRGDILTSESKEGVPIVGFFYSISRDGIPEFWPLHLGLNTIGRSPECDVQLKERTVSSNHAVLSIKQMKSTGRFIATIRDVGSKSGMYINEKELDYDNHTCKHEDVISVGENYQLLLLLVDAVNYNLKPAKNFMPLKGSETARAAISDPDAIQAPSTVLYTRPGHIEDGTVDLSGLNRMPDEGGETRILE